MPIIKRLWTCSMTLFSGGLCFLLMGLFYYWIDYKGHTYGLDWLKIYGMNSITAYILGEVVNFRCIAASISYGLEQFLGNYYSVWLSFANYLIVFFILQMMYKHRIFENLKILQWIRKVCIGIINDSCRYRRFFFTVYYFISFLFRVTIVFFSYNYGYAK